MGPSAETAIPAELLDRELERQARAQRRLFEEEGDGLAVERVRIFPRRLLDGRRQVEQGEEFVIGEVEIPEQVRGGEFRDPAYGGKRVATAPPA